MLPTRLLLALPLVAPVMVACGGDTTRTEATNVSIVASEYHFDPSEVTVPAGPVTFTVRNDGSEEHEFEILQGDAVIDEMEGLVPGLERDLTVDLAAGEYTIVCRLADHEQRGMTGTLTVTG